MKKRFLLLPLLALTLACCAESKDNSLPEVDIAVTNLKYEGTTLCFDSVESAIGYSLQLVKNKQVLFDDVIQKESIDLSPLNVYGNVEASVRPLFADKVGKSTAISIVSLKKFDSLYIEAESGSYNIGTGKDLSNYRWNECASDTYYIGGIDDRGQGVYFNLLIPFDGTYEFRCHYAAMLDDKNAHDDVWVNNAYAGRFEFNEGQGWFGSSPVGYLMNLPVAKTNITLHKGWNTVSVFKMGTAADNWGSFAELDYFEIIGSGEAYNPDELEASFGKEPSVYRLEAEMGSPRRFNTDTFIYECKNAPVISEGGATFSNDFCLGNIESDYDGVEWRFKAKQEGKYALKLNYASQAFEGSKKPRPTYVVTQEPIDVEDGYLFAEYKQYVLPELDYTSSWVDFIDAPEIEIDLEKGVNYIYCLLLDDQGSGYFRIDYADMRFVR